jgi:UDP-2,3-diacylglucosamine pyrophosphatase LpxH
MPTFREKVALLKALCNLIANNLATLWPAVQEEAVQQVSVEVQRQIIEHTQEQASVFCFGTVFQYLYNHMFLTAFGIISATFEFYTSLISEGTRFLFMFGGKFCIYLRDFMRVSRKVNDWVGITLQDWVYILLVFLLVSVLFCIVFPWIFRILDWFKSESDKPEKEILVKSKKSGARGKSPHRKAEKKSE